jgi:thermostable 8-oxoguanine DNA glycosylase
MEWINTQAMSSMEINKVREFISGTMGTNMKESLHWIRNVDKEQ